MPLDWRRGARYPLTTRQAAEKDVGHQEAGRTAAGREQRGTWMTNLIERGWNHQEQPNGAATSWLRQGPGGLSATMSISKTGEIGGTLNAGGTGCAIQGQLLLHDLPSIDDAATRLEKLLDAVTVDSPQKLHLVTDEVQAASG